jgi:hypothetical protein
MGRQGKRHGNCRADTERDRRAEETLTKIDVAHDAIRWLDQAG